MTLVAYITSLQRRTCRNAGEYLTSRLFIVSRLLHASLRYKTRHSTRTRKRVVQPRRQRRCRSKSNVERSACSQYRSPSSLVVGRYTTQQSSTSRQRRDAVSVAQSPRKRLLGTTPDGRAAKDSVLFSHAGADAGEASQELREFSRSIFSRLAQTAIVIGSLNCQPTISRQRRDAGPRSHRRAVVVR